MMYRLQSAVNVILMAGTITALKAQRGAKDRVNVHLDGEFAFGLALIHALWLKIGQSLSDHDIEALKSADSIEQAQKLALNMIVYRPRSAREVRQRLKKAGVDDVRTEEVIGQLQQSGLLDDEAFSKAWVESRLRASPRSKRMIRWELKQKGVGEKEIAAAVDEVDDVDTAYRAALKRLTRLKSLDAIERKRKLQDYLARNGFDYETIEQVWQKIETLED
jgi:regulatory protein